MDLETNVIHVSADRETDDRFDFLLIKNGEHTVTISEMVGAQSWHVIMHDESMHVDIQEQIVTGNVFAAIDLASEMLGQS